MFKEDELARRVRARLHSALAIPLTWSSMKTQRLFTSVRRRLLIKNVDVVHFSSSILEGSRRSHLERLSVALRSCPEASIVAALARRNIPRGARERPSSSLKTKSLDALSMKVQGFDGREGNQKENPRSLSRR